MRGRRAEIVAAVSAGAPTLEFVNGGGTGSLEQPRRARTGRHRDRGRLGLLRADAVRPYTALHLRPAALFAMPVVRRPAPCDRDRARRRLPRLRPRRDRTGCPTPVPARRAAPRPAGGRRRGADAADRRSRGGPARSATASTSATRRPASCASASTACTWSSGDESSTRCRPTAARADVPVGDGVVRCSQLPRRAGREARVEGRASAPKEGVSSAGFETGEGTIVIGSRIHAGFGPYSRHESDRSRPRSLRAHRLTRKVTRASRNRISALSLPDRSRERGSTTSAIRDYASSSGPLPPRGPARGPRTRSRTRRPDRGARGPPGSGPSPGSAGASVAAAWKWRLPQWGRPP